MSGNLSILIPLLIFVYFSIGKVDSSVEDMAANTAVSSGIALKEKFDTMVKQCRKKAEQKAEAFYHISLYCWPEGSAQEHKDAAKEGGQIGAHLVGTVHHH